MHNVYVLYSDKIKRHYVGQTKNVEKRLEHHNLGLNRWSKRGVPWKLIYSERYNTKTEAIGREMFFKSGIGRRFILAEVAKVVTARV